MIEKMISAAKAGGAVLKNYFGESVEITQKSTVADFRTKADVESEDAVLAILEHEFPEYSIFSEEKGAVDKNSEYTFIIDPLDGTNNFVVGVPNFSVSIGLLQNDEIIAGVIYSPMIDNVYYAEKGSGAYFDGKRITVSTETDIKRATMCYNCSYETPAEEESRAMRGLYSLGGKRVMTNWSPTFDFCMLASGRIEGVVVDNCELYDFAAGKIIAREAGALITDRDGNPEASDKNQCFIISNGREIHKRLVAIMLDK
jgi:myo-inositol-1(or 4)-monophosphatase